MTPVDYLYSLELHGIKLGLENIRHLLSEGGDPHRAYPTVHVGGTNGKGSVVAMLDAMLRAAGYRTGRFTSPHLCSVRERFLIEGRRIHAEALDGHIEFFRAIAGRRGLRPTFFELGTAIAFRHFAEESVHVALIEVGMGGRFDSTNVIAPEAIGIANIALEHTKYLGDTLEAIAFEKAGILKQGVPAVTGETAAGPLGVIAARAKEVGCPLSVLDQDYRYTLERSPTASLFTYTSKDVALQECPLALPGEYQGMNAAIAVRMAEYLRVPFPRLTEACIVKGLGEAKWPCRLETVLESPKVIIDVAHNAAGAKELARALDVPGVLVLAIANDKDAGRIIEILSPKATTLILTSFAGARALSVADLCSRAGSAPHERCETLDEAVDLGMQFAQEQGVPLVIAGSMFTAGEARTILVERYGAPPLEF